MTIAVPDYIDDKVKEKVNAVLKLVGQTLPSNEKPEDIFVSNPLADEGPTNLSAWIFTRCYIVEIRNPHIDGRIQYDVAPLKDSVDWIRLDARRFKLHDPEPESQLALEFSTTDGFSGELLASGKGCSRLMEIYGQQLLKNFTRRPAEG